MKVRSARAGLGAAICILLVACGRAPIAQGPGGETASPARTDSPSAFISPSPWPSGSPWPRYADTTYHFTISYPPSFVFQPQHGIDGAGILMLYRAVDPFYQNGYSPGEIDIGMYKNDAQDLASWVAKHSGPPSSTDANRYWSPVTSQALVTVAGHDGLSFVWVADSNQLTIHATGVVLGTFYVLTVSWWGSTSAYATAMQQNTDQMLRDLMI